MRMSDDVQKLCGSWWDRLAGSTQAEHRRFAEQFLGMYGWTDPMEPQPDPGGRGPTGLCYLLGGELRPIVAAHFVLPGVLEPPKAVVDRKLDFCQATGRLVDASRDMNAHYAFITDLFRSYLYDVRTDELLVHADTAETFVREFEDTLYRDKIEAGELDEVRRQPRSYVARQFREWAEQWYETLMLEWRTAEDVAWMVVDRLVVLRYLREHDVLRRVGWRLDERYDELMSLGWERDPQGCGKRLTDVWGDLAKLWGLRLFESRPGVEAVAEQDAVAAPLLREFTLLSRSKFATATILESFNYGEADEKARVRMIPEEDEDRRDYLAKQTAATVDEARVKVDLVDEGYRAMFHWLDRLVGMYERLAVEFDSTKIHQHTTQQELDLFRWSEIDSHRPGALTDPLHYALERGLVVYCATPRQVRTARLMLHLHVIDRYAQGRTRCETFPPVEAALHERPQMTEVDRRIVLEGSPTDEWEAI